MNIQTILLLALPVLPSFWAIHHAFFHTFPKDTERLLWICLNVFVPVIGAIIYFFCGRTRATGKIKF